MAILYALFAFLIIGGLVALLTKRAAVRRALAKLYLALAVLIAFIFFFVAARLALPVPDSGPSHVSGEAIRGAMSMYHVSEVFVGALFVICVFLGILALRPDKNSQDGA